MPGTRRDSGGWAWGQGGRGQTGGGRQGPQEKAGRGWLMLCTFARSGLHPPQACPCPNPQTLTPPPAPPHLDEGLDVLGRAVDDPQPLLQGLL
jgi:hypothetical protein